MCINGSGVLQNAQGHTRRSDNGVCVNFTGSVGSPRGVSILALIAKRTKSVTAAESGRVSERDCRKLLHSFSVTLAHFVSPSLAALMNGQGWRGQQLESRESLEWQAAGLEPWTQRTSGLCVLSTQTVRSDGHGRAEPSSSGIWP